MIRLMDLLQISPKEYGRYKVHFSIGTAYRKEEYDAFLRGEFADRQAVQTRKNFQCDFVISLVYYDTDEWMFAGVYRVVCPKPTAFTENGRDLWRYNLALTDTQKDLIGRLFVQYKKQFRASYPSLETRPKLGDAPADMCVLQILKERVDFRDFRGFDQIQLQYADLKYIVDNNVLVWKTALSNVKGIYLIADRNSGQLYVGSAYGEYCIWQRWTQYAANGHGGNVKLKELLAEKGEQYKYNFQYAVLEVCNMNLGDNYIIERETHWKNILLTRKFGLNEN